MERHPLGKWDLDDDLRPSHVGCYILQCPGRLRIKISGMSSSKGHRRRLLKQICNETMDPLLFVI